MFRQQENRGIRTTFRSKGKHDVGALAEGLGGGGRPTASGVLLPMGMGDAMDCVLPLVYEMLARSGDPQAQRRVREGMCSWGGAWIPGASPADLYESRLLGEAGRLEDNLEAAALEGTALEGTALDVRVLDA
jgi:hypothetical protein